MPPSTWAWRAGDLPCRSPSERTAFASDEGSPDISVLSAAGRSGNTGHGGRLCVAWGQLNRLGSNSLMKMLNPRIDSWWDASGAARGAERIGDDVPSRIRSVTRCHDARAFRSGIWKTSRSTPKSAAPTWSPTSPDGPGVPARCGRYMTWGGYGNTTSSNRDRAEIHGTSRGTSATSSRYAQYLVSASVASACGRPRRSLPLVIDLRVWLTAPGLRPR
jgi:hypothetical protein